MSKAHVADFWDSLTFGVNAYSVDDIYDNGFGDADIYDNGFGAF